MRRKCRISYVIEDDRAPFARQWVAIMPCGKVRTSHAKYAPEALACSLPRKAVVVKVSDSTRKGEGW